MSENDVEVKFGATTADFDARVAELRSSLSSFGEDAGDVVSTTSEKMKGLTLATSGVSTELIRLGHEAISGNLSRMPGSLLVLASRMGGLTLATLGWGAAIGGAVAGAYELVAASERSAESMNHMQIALEAQNRSFDDESIQGYINQLSKLHGISTSTAETITTEFATATNVSTEAMGKLINIVNDYASVTGQKAPQAAQALVKMAEDPMRAAIKLSETYTGIITPAQFNAIEGFERLGNKEAEMDVIAEALQARFGGLGQKGLTPLQALSTSVGNAFSWLGQKIETVSEAVTKFESQFTIDQFHLDDDDSDDKAAAAKATAAQNQKLLNGEVVRGLALSLQVGGYLNEEAKLRGEIAQIAQAASAATIEGDSKDAQTLLQTQKQLQTQLDNLRNTDTQQHAAALSLKRSEDQAYYSQSAEMIRTQADLKQITTQQEYAMLNTALEQEWELENKSFDQQLQLYNKDAAAYQKLLQQKQSAYQKFQLDVLKLQKQEVDANNANMKKEESEWRGMISRVSSTFSSGVLQMIKHQETLGQFIQNIDSAILGSFLDMMAKRAAGWLADQLLGDTSAKDTGTSQITTDAAVAGAGAYAAIAAIPYIGPALAPGAAATAYAGTMAYESLLALDQGAWSVNEGIYHLHDDEAVLPKAQATKFRDGAANNLLDNKSGGGGGDTHFHISAMDSRDVKRFFAQHGATISKVVAGHIRNGARPGS